MAPPITIKRSVDCSLILPIAAIKYAFFEGREYTNIWVGMKLFFFYEFELYSFDTDIGNSGNGEPKLIDFYDAV